MKMKKTIAVFLAAALALFFGACKKKSASNADKTILYTLSSDPVTLDPQIAGDAASLTAVTALFEGLTRLGADGSAEPGAAQSWESNADSTQFTFHLRSGIRWSAKKYGSVTADDFVFAFRRALDPSTGSSACLKLFCVKNAAPVHSGALPVDSLGAEAPDPETFVVTLEYSCPDFPALAASAVCMPCCEAFFRQTAGRYGLETASVLGNGPFCIDGSYGWDHGKKLSLARSDTYTGGKTPLPSGITFTVGSGDSAAAAALLNGTADAAPLAAANVAAAKSAGCTVVSLPNSVCGLCFNTKSSLFRNEKVRLAFLQAFRRENVLAHLPADTEAAESIFLPVNGEKSALAGEPLYPAQDSAAAQTLQAGLAELGLASVPSVAVLCPDDPDVKLMVSEMIAAWNGAFRQYFNMQPLSGDELKNRVAAGNYTVALCPLSPSSGERSSLLSLFASGAAGNPAGLSDAAYDSLADAAARSGGAQADAACAEAEAYLCGRGVFYPLYFENCWYASAKGVTGIVFHPFRSGIDFRDAGKL